MRKIVNKIIKKISKLCLHLKVNYLFNLVRPEFRIKNNIFILGSYNSGTTLLADYCATRLNALSTNTEGDSFVNELITPEKLGYSRYITKCADAIKENVNIMSKSDSERVKRKLMFGANNKYDSEIFLEKSISHSLRIRWLRDNFDNPLFIWITRNPYCAAEGLLRRSNGSSRRISVPDILTAFEQIRFINDEIQKHLSECEVAYIKIKYEDFVDNPNDVLNKIYDKLKSPRSMSAERDYIFSFHGEKERVVNKNDSSLQRLTNSDIRQINSLHHAWIMAQGYEICEPF